MAGAVSLGLLDLDVAGSGVALVGTAVVSAVLGSALGLLASAFARTEFQAVQFMPAFVLPQLLLCGLFVPRSTMQPALEAISAALPLSYAVDAMTAVAGSPGLTADAAADLGVLAAFVAGSLLLGAGTLRRRTD
ncbi:MAG: ABC transporter permease [Geodermatophilaceae bacterium]